MKIVGEATLVAPVEKVWDALLDPSVLVATIPGCERLEATGENAYSMTVTAGVAAVRGTYAGTCELRDLERHHSLVLAAQGAGTPGTIAADVSVSFDDNGDGTTTLHYDADTVVGGMIGGVGQRMLTSVSRRLATEFFVNVERQIAQGVPGVLPPTVGSGVAEQSAGELAGEPASASVTAGGGAVFTAPPTVAGGRDDFVKGVAVGAGLVLAGVLAGALVGRRH